MHSEDWEKEVSQEAGHSQEEGRLYQDPDLGRLQHLQEVIILEENTKLPLLIEWLT